MTSQNEYYYAVSRIRVMEKGFLDRSTLAKLLEQRRVADAVKLLTDAGFGEKNRDYTGEVNFETLLTDEYNKAFRTVYELAPQKDLFDLFLLKNDYHNLKVIIKSELLQRPHPELALSSGSIPFERLETAVRERRFAGLPAEMEQAAQESLAHFAKTHDPQVVDMICDRMEFAQSARKAQEISNPFLREYLSMRADFANLKAFLRVRKAGQGADFLKRALVEGGVIRPEAFLANLAGPLDAFLSAVTACPYLDAVKSAVLFYEQHTRFGGVEKILDDHVISFIAQARRIAFGPEVLIAYLVARENEIKNARIILGGIESGASPDVLRERIREPYV